MGAARVVAVRWMVIATACTESRILYTCVEQAVRLPGKHARLSWMRYRNGRQGKVRGNPFPRIPIPPSFSFHT
jgi:hypothetical protein